MQGQPYAIQGFTGLFTPSLKLKVWTDQIGSIRALATDFGAVIKYLEYEAFGNITLDTKSEWSFPLGFAGSLNDIYTDFVRFGFRDYDPQVGRFTAKDPIGDTGGDHDLWDYCVDDPVSMNDPSGLFPPLLAFLAGKALALAIGGAGVYGAAKVVDEIKSNKDGKKRADAIDALNQIAPKVAAVSAASVLPGVAVMAPSTVTAAGQRVGGLIQTSKHGEKIVNAAPHVKDFIEGLTIAGPPAMTRAAIAGYAASEIAKKAEKGK